MALSIFVVTGPNKYLLQVDIVCFVFLWFLVTFPYVSWSISELRMKLVLLNMLLTVQRHSNVDPFQYSFHVCLGYAFLAFKT